MSNFTKFKIFEAMKMLILEQIELTNDRAVVDIISDLDINIWEDGLPANLVLWDDWKNVLNGVGNENKNIADGLTPEQGCIAMCIFLDKRYWEKNNDMLLVDVYNDLEKERDGILESNLWKDWIAAVEEGIKFNRVFDKN